MGSALVPPKSFPISVRKSYSPNDLGRHRRLGQILPTDYCKPPESEQYLQSNGQRWHGWACRSSLPIPSQSARRLPRMKFTVDEIKKLKLPAGKDDHTEYSDDVPGWLFRMRRTKKGANC